MGLQAETNGLCRQVDLVVCVHDGTNQRILGCHMGRNHAHITTHDLQVGQLALQSAGGIYFEALGTDTHDHILVSHTGYIQNSVLAQDQLAIGNLAIEHVDGRSTQELCNEQVTGIVIDFLGLADLLQYA